MFLPDLSPILQEFENMVARSQAVGRRRPIDPGGGEQR